MQEKVNEVKQQMLSSKRLREYFDENPQEKEILRADLSKTAAKQNFYIYRHLGTLPHYALPNQVLAVTPEQILTAVAGSKYFIPKGMNGTLPIPDDLKNEKVVDVDRS
jgi:hypothetical protein